MHNSQKTFSFHDMVLAIKTQAEINAHIRKWRKYVRFMARPSREWIVLKDTSQLFTKMLRCSARSALKSLIAKMQWLDINKNVVFVVCVVSTSQTRLS